MYDNVHMLPFTFPLGGISHVDVGATIGDIN